MKILLVYGALGLGGIETMIVRMVDWLTKNGVKITFLQHETKRGDLDADLPDSVEKIKIKDPFSVRSLKKALARTGMSRLDFDAVLVFEPFSLCVTSFLARHLSSETRLAVGVYHPKAYFLFRRVPWFMKRAGTIFDRNVDDKSKYFMNDRVRESHESYFGRSFTQSRIIPIPLTERHERDQRKPLKGRIVSVGRLTAFKTYNVYMIDIIRALTSKGYDVEWHVYGSGKLEELMRKKIGESGVEDRIFLHGIVEYSRLEEIWKSSYLFVGMGTALLEAGYAGVPAIPAVVGKGPVTYGFLEEIPYYHVGEELCGKDLVPVQEMIEKVLQMGDQDYLAECHRVQDYCDAYSIERIGPSFLKYLEQETGSIRNLKEVPFHRFVQFKVVWEIQRITQLGMTCFLNIGKTLLPPGLRERVRRVRRRKTGLNSLREHGIDYGDLVESGDTQDLPKE